MMMLKSTLAKDKTIQHLDLGGASLGRDNGVMLGFGNMWFTNAAHVWDASDWTRHSVTMSSVHGNV
jgi:hypothetical protein